MMTKKIIGILLGCFMLLAPHTALASEVANSYYFPIMSFAPALAPHPGAAFVDQMIYLNQTANKAVIGGRVEADVRADVFFDFFGYSQTGKPSKSGQTFQWGVFVPYAKVSLNAGIDGVHGSAGVSDSTSSIGDATLMGSWFWKKGDMHYKVTQTVFAPTGPYTLGNLSNVSRNYWGFDTSFAMTHIDMKTGWEFSLQPGIMFNTKNYATDYQTGTEFHVEFGLNKHFFKQHYAIGLQGYYYKQISGDSGSGAVLGSFEGEVFGIGPAILWKPPAGKGKVIVVAKWMVDLYHVNRLHGNSVQLAIVNSF